MEAFAGMSIVVTLFLIVLAVLWICMPFALFGTKPLLRQLVAEQKKTNELLKSQAERANAIRDRSDRLEPRLQDR